MDLAQDPHAAAIFNKIYYPKIELPQKYGRGFDRLFNGSIRAYKPFPASMLRNSPMNISNLSRMLGRQSFSSLALIVIALIGCSASDTATESASTMLETTAETDLRSWFTVDDEGNPWLRVPDMNPMLVMSRGKRPDKQSVANYLEDFDFSDSELTVNGVTLKPIEKGSLMTDTFPTITLNGDEDRMTLSGKLRVPKPLNAFYEACDNVWEQRQALLRKNKMLFAAQFHDQADNQQIYGEGYILTRGTCPERYSVYLFVDPRSSATGNIVRNAKIFANESGMLVFDEFDIHTRIRDATDKLTLRVTAHLSDYDFHARGGRTGRHEEGQLNFEQVIYQASFIVHKTSRAAGQ